MNHVKKMILVPHDSVARMHDTVAPTPQSQMSSLDTEMNYIMRKQYADDSEKWKKYNETLQRYLHFAKESRKPITFEIESKTDEKSEGNQTNSAMRQQLMAAMPKTYKDHAVKIYDYLVRDGSPVTWDSTGQVSIQGNLIRQSNIIDLISDLTRSRKSFVPVGVDKFVDVLAQMNIPLDFIGNEHRRTAVLRAKQPRQTGSGIVKKQSARVTKKQYVWKHW